MLNWWLQAADARDPHGRSHPIMAAPGAAAAKLAHVEEQCFSASPILCSFFRATTRASFTAHRFRCLATLDTVALSMAPALIRLYCCGLTHKVKASTLIFQSFPGFEPP